MWNIKVPVTKEHVENATRRDSHHCMIADAVHDRLKWATYVQADTQSIRFNNKKAGKRYIFLTPPEAQKAIVMFDQGVKVKPFSFTLAAGYMRQRKMRALSSKKKAHLKRYNKNPHKHTPSQFREFGLRRMAR